MREVRGKRYGEWVIGEVYETGRRTVTETDIVNLPGFPEIIISFIPMRFLPNLHRMAGESLMAPSFFQSQQVW